MGYLASPNNKGRRKEFCELSNGSISNGPCGSKKLKHLCDKLGPMPPRVLGAASEVSQGNTPTN